MFNNTSISTCPGFQPNSALPQHSAGFNALLADITLRPSFAYVMTETLMCQGSNHLQLAETVVYQINNRFQLIETIMGTRAGQQLNDIQGQPREMQQVGGFTDKKFFDKINKGKHYSRPDGLPPSPPPEQRRRYEKEGGVAKS